MLFLSLRHRDPEKEMVFVVNCTAKQRMIESILRRFKRRKMRDGVLLPGGYISVSGNKYITRSETLFRKWLRALLRRPKFPRLKDKLSPEDIQEQRLYDEERSGSYEQDNFLVSDHSVDIASTDEAAISEENLIDHKRHRQDHNYRESGQSSGTDSDFKP